MVFAPLARGKKNKKCTVVTIENENKEQKNHPFFSQNSFSRISIDRTLLCDTKQCAKVDLASVKIMLDVFRRKRLNHAS